MSGYDKFAAEERLRRMLANSSVSIMVYPSGDIVVGAGHPHYEQKAFSISEVSDCRPLEEAAWAFLRAAGLQHLVPDELEGQ